MTTQRFGHAAVHVPDGARLTLTIPGEEPGDLTEHAALLLHQGAHRPSPGPDADAGSDLVTLGTVESDTGMRYYLNGRRISSHAALEHVARGIVEAVTAGARRVAGDFATP